MKKPFIIFSYFGEDIKNWESEVPLSPPQKQAGKGTRLKSQCPHCGDTSPPRTGAGRKPGEASLHCASCKRFIQWIGVAELRALAQKGGNHGK
jgi:hypothetical protein